MQTGITWLLFTMQDFIHGEHVPKLGLLASKIKKPSWRSDVLKFCHASIIFTGGKYVRIYFGVHVN